MLFAPEIAGTVSIRSAPDRFAEAWRERVQAGLLSGRPHPRSNYRIEESGSGGTLRVLAADWWTAVNVGLNDVELQLPHSGSVQYRVRYWQWAWFAAGFSAILGLLGVALLLGFDVRSYIEANPASRVPGLSPDQNVGVVWGMVTFWGFVWPWVLVALHKRPLHGLVRRLVAEVDDRALRG